MKFKNIVYERLDYFSHTNDFNLWGRAEEALTGHYIIFAVCINTVNAEKKQIFAEGLLWKRTESVSKNAYVLS